MDRGPKDFASMFTLEWCMSVKKNVQTAFSDTSTCADLDLVYYGLVMAGISLGNFTATLYGYFQGYLGYGCNEELLPDICHDTGTARAACFSSFLIVLMCESYRPR